MKNKTTIKITELPKSSVPEKILLQRFCLLRKCEKVGDTETVNNTQLGRLRDNAVKFEILSNTQKP